MQVIASGFVSTMGQIYSYTLVDPGGPEARLGNEERPYTQAVSLSQARPSASCLIRYRTWPLGHCALISSNNNITVDDIAVDDIESYDSSGTAAAAAARTAAHLATTCKAPRISIYRSPHFGGAAEWAIDLANFS
jgi:hypothetical protein